MILYKSSFCLHLQGRCLYKIHLGLRPSNRLGLPSLMAARGLSWPSTLHSLPHERAEECFLLFPGGSSCQWLSVEVVQAKIIACTESSPSCTDTALTITLSPAWKMPLHPWILNLASELEKQTPLPKSCWLQASCAVPATPDSSFIPFPPSPNPPNLGWGVALEENFPNLLVTNLCSNKSYSEP